jgi:hypothetical protein
VCRVNLHAVGYLVLCFVYAWPEKGIVQQFSCRPRAVLSYMCCGEKEIDIIQLLLLPGHAVVFAHYLTFRPGFTTDCHCNLNKVLVQLHVWVVITPLQGCCVHVMHIILLILFEPCQIWSSHSSDCESYCLLGCDTLLSGRCSLMFQRNVLPPSSWLKSDCRWEHIICLNYR